MEKNKNWSKGSYTSVSNAGMEINESLHMGGTLALLQIKAEMVEEKVIWLNDIQLEQISELMCSI